jgi:hypothetical protein
MTEQLNWVPLPRKRIDNIKIEEALERVNPLAEWYHTYKPLVKRIVVSKGDYKSFQEAVGTESITENESGLHYRGFLIAVAP